MVETVEMDTGEQAIVIEENYAKITEANQLQRNKYMIGSSTEWHQILVSIPDVHLNVYSIFIII